MILKVALSLLVFTLLEEISIEGSDCLPDLKNLAVYEGYENTMMNQTANPNNTRWSIIPTSDEFGYHVIWEYGVYGDPPLTGLYYFNQSGLVILDATTNGQPISTSGLYIVDCANNENRTGAKLVVVSAGPECSCNANAPDANQLSCSIIYADGTLHPIYANMTWKNGGLAYTTETPPRTRIDETVFESTSTITVDNSVSATFTCTVTFNAPTEINYPFIATNAPEFSASCSVAVCGLKTTTTQPSTAEPSSTISDDCSQSMKNIAVYEGYENILMNLTTNANNVLWRVTPCSNEFDDRTIQDNNGIRDSELTGLFYPNQSGLVILNATTTPNGGPISTAGLYIAQCANSTNKTGAKLLVVREAPECSCSTSSPNAVQLSCSIIYADGTLHPIYANMTWTIGGVVYTTDTPQRTRIDDYVFKSTSTITVDNSAAANYEIIVTFNAPTEIEYPYIATNAPEFNASCSVAVCGLTTTEPPTTTPGYCYPNMKNMAVREGTLDVAMNVTASPCAVTWSVLPTSNEFTGRDIIFRNCTKDSTLEAFYYVNGSGIIIRNSTTTDNGQPDLVSTSGLYIAECNSNAERTGAKFVVVHSGPDCSCIRESSSSNVQLKCSTKFADCTTHPIPPIMTWMVNGAYYTEDTPDKNKTDGYVYTAISAITVDATVNDYQCILTFGEPTDITYDWIATNAPEFNATCSTPCADAV